LPGTTVFSFLGTILPIAVPGLVPPPGFIPLSSPIAGPPRGMLFLFSPLLKAALQWNLSLRPVKAGGEDSEAWSVLAGKLFVYLPFDLRRPSHD